MSNKRIKKFLSVILIFGILYSLLKTNTSNSVKPGHSSNSNATSQDPKLDNMTAQVLATHIPMPLMLRGKKLPFHNIYEPREVGFASDLKYGRAFNETKVILLWTPWNSVHKTINYYSLQTGKQSFLNHNCPNANCIATRNRKRLHQADAVLFHLIDTKTTDLPAFRVPHQFWILYNMEPPWLVKKHLSLEIHKFKNFFNWTMSYRSNSDIIAKYGFIASESNKNYQLNTELFGKKKKNIVWFASDCTTDSKREDYVHELKKYIDVDIYGECGTHKCFPSQSSVCYDEVLNKYKFYLSFENAICKDYVTEKFFNIFNYNIIPIIFGGANYSSLVPEGTFIDATYYPQPKKLANILQKIGKNEELYMRIIKKKRQFTAYLDPWMCKLCDRLHSSTTSKTLSDVEKWWFQEAHCKTWSSRNQTYIDINFYNKIIKKE